MNPKNPSALARKNAKVNVATIPLSLRGKKRYVLFHVTHDGAAMAKEIFFRALHQYFLEMFGTLGYPLHRVKFISFDSNSGAGILRCTHTSKETIVAALVLCSRLNGQAVRIHPRSVSGSLRVLRRKLFLIPHVNVKQSAGAH